MNASRMISLDSNQSSRCPRESSSCVEAMAIESDRKPVQSRGMAFVSYSRGKAKREAIVAATETGRIM